MLTFRKTTIRSLFPACSPSAIARLIVAVIVNALKGMLRRWLWPHVGQEILKRVAPMFANRNTTSAVAGISLVTGVEATLLHITPDLIFARARLPVCGEKLDSALNDAFALETTAALRLAASERATAHNQLSAAIATAIPAGVVGAGGMNADHSQTAVAVSSPVYETVRAWGKLLFSHIVPPVYGVVRTASGVTSTGRCSLVCHQYTHLWGVAQ